MPFIVGIVGRSDAGKTTLILRLIPELTKRGYRVGTVKNCPHGFEIDRKGKDSYRFSKKGSKGILLTSPGRATFIRNVGKEENGDIIRTIAWLFHDFDIVLVEGFSEEERLRRIEVLRKQVSEKIISCPERLIAVVSDMDIKTNKPIFKPDEISEIVNFLEEAMKEEKKEYKESVEVIVNGERLFLNSFLQDMVRSLTSAMVSPLRRKNKEDIKEIVIKITNPT